MLKRYDGMQQSNEKRSTHEVFWVQLHDLPFGCITREVGRSIKKTVGMVQKVNVNEEGKGWGKFLRVKVMVDITNPLAQRRFLNLPGKKIWVYFQYKRLPQYCFHCGIIKHGLDRCRAKEERLLHGEVGPAQYGTWLHAEVLRSMASEGESMRSMVVRLIETAKEGEGCAASAVVRQSKPIGS